MFLLSYIINRIIYIYIYIYIIAVNDIKIIMIIIMIIIEVTQKPIAVVLSDHHGQRVLVHLSLCKCNSKINSHSNNKPIIIVILIVIVTNHNQ